MENQPVTLDSLMADFVCDMTVADDELSESIFTCVDNFIDVYKELFKKSKKN